MAAEIASLGIEIKVNGADAATSQLNNLTNTGKSAETQSSSLSSAFDKLGYSTSALSDLMMKAAGAFALFEVSKQIADTTLLAARYETLGVVMNVVGNNAGYTAAQMVEFQKGLQQTGISAVESRQGLALMGQAQVDMAESSKLARVAQDAAVIANTNSSEAFNRMMTGISTGQAIILHHMGLMVNFEKGYKELADTLGKTKEEMTSQELTQARVNEVMRVSVGISGSYEAAMGTVGKAMNSMKRYVDDLKVAFGELFTPALGVIVDELTKSLKSNGDWFKDNKDIVKQWGDGFKDTLITIAAEVTRLSMLLDKAGGSMSSAMMLLYGPGAALGNANSKAQFDKFAQMNLDFEARYQAGEARLQAMAGKMSDVAPAGKAWKDRPSADRSEDLETILPVIIDNHLALQKETEKWREAERAVNMAYDKSDLDEYKNTAALKAEMVKGQLAARPITEQQSLDALYKIEQDTSAKEIALLQKTSDASIDAYNTAADKWNNASPPVFKGDLTAYNDAVKQYNDLYTTVEKLDKESITAGQSLSDAMDKAKLAGQKYTDATLANNDKIRISNEAAKALQLEMELATINSNEKFYQIGPDQASAQRIANAQQMVALLQTQYNEVQDSNVAEQTRAQLLSKIRTENEKILDQQKAIYDRTAIGGMTNAIQEYGLAAADVGTQMKTAFTNAFKGMEDALVSFVMTGTLNFRAMANSIISDIVRIEVKQQIMAPMVAGIGSLLAPAAISYAASGLSGPIPYALGQAAEFTLAPSVGPTIAAATQVGATAGTSAGIMSGLATAAPYIGAAIAVGMTANSYFKSGGIWDSSSSDQKWTRVIAGVMTGGIANVIDALTGGKLFGSNWKVSGGGVALGVSGGDVTGQGYVDQHKDGGWFSHSSNKTNYAPLDQQWSDFVNMQYDSIKTAIKTQSQIAGVTITDAMLNSVNITMSKVNLTGLSAADQQKAVNDAFRKISNDTIEAANPAIVNMERLGEDATATLQRLTDLKLTNNSLQMQILEVQGLKDTAQYMALVNVQRQNELLGLDDSTIALKNNLWALQDKAAADQKAADLLKTNNGLTVTLLTAQGKSAEALALQRQLDTAGMDASTLAIQNQIYALADQKTALDSVTASQQKMVAATISNADNAFKVLQNSITAEKASQQAQYDAAKKAEQANFDSLTKSVASLTSLSTALQSATNSINPLTWAQALGQINAAVLAAKNGTFADSASLQNALGVLSKPSTSQFATLQDFQRSQQEAANSISTLQSLTDKQLTSDQQALDISQKQLNALDAGFAASTASLDGILSTAQAQLDALNGINNSILSVSAASSGVTTAVNLSKAYSSTISTTGQGFDYSQIGSHALQKVNYNGTDYTVTGSNEAAKSAYLTALDGSTIMAPTMDLRSYAVGTDYVPYDMKANIHEGERIIPKADNYAITKALTGGNNDALIAVVNALREEVAQLRSEQSVDNRDIKKYVRRSADLFEMATEGGNAMRTVPA